MKRCFLLPRAELSIPWLRKHIDPGDTILALSLEGLVSYRDNFQNVYSIEDLVPYPEIMALALQAHEVNKEFSRRSCDGATLEGYDWPAICWHMQQWFFRDSLLTTTLSVALKREGFDRIVWVGSVRREPAIYLPTLDAVATFMSFEFKERFERLAPPGEMQGKGRVFRRKARFGAERLYKRLFCHAPGIVPTRIVAVFAITEWDRYTDALSDLKRTFGRDFQFWILGARYPEQLAAWAKKEGIDPVGIPYPDKVGKVIDEFFDERWRQWLNRGRKVFADAVNAPLFAEDQIQYHFEFYFRKMWPVLAQWANRLEQYLQQAKPAWVIGSSNYPPEWAFPHFVAKKLGIPSIALPHSYVQYGDGEVPASYLACRNRIERENFKTSFPQNERIFYCSNAGNTLSYTVQSTHRKPSDKRVVAYLTAHPDYNGSIMPTANRPVFMESLRALRTIPPDMNDLLFEVKSHPRADVTPFLKTDEGLPPNVVVLDPSSSVIELIERSWVIVLVNHYGSVAVQAVMSGKPIIFLDSAKSCWPYTEKIAFAAGEVVEDMPSFWSFLRKLKNTPALYADLSAGCRRFKESYFEPASQTLAQQIKALELHQPHRIEKVMEPPVQSERETVSLDGERPFVRLQ